MKLVRFGLAGGERPGILDQDGRVRDLSEFVSDLEGDVLTRAGLERLSSIDPASLPLVPDGIRLGVPVGRVGKIICVGLNYSDHAAESGMEEPDEPILFMKATSALCGPNDDVVLPHGAEAVDWEIELAIIIGDRARNIDASQSMKHIAGYAILNDLSEREWQLERGGQWMKGKSSDTFAPVGPWLVTSDEIEDPQTLAMSLDLNGVRLQNGCSETMIFPVVELVSYISRFMTLDPGDIISTGTPPGVGLGQKPPFYLREGDVMELTISGLGRQRQKTVRAVAQ
ncbi:MAG TPA: fumarylacetoacetate hydrolase family protein [Hyphomonas sp.]|nr:MAG: 2-hydroxyhepta-2,4-diene-1,7-dioate isomerase [Hyphomonadaceae bacterium BRH_c29]HAY05297.1 FAA hydrolase family protein [Hyphomonas sp.]HRI99210.1 fumarylacetoacetate hydrolase family protein [Hyphomonas sp.]HRK65997.1 fumarylacetoacetate hydrolase family protein [Hyphomonas sp.]